jgi:hypothetical protein
LDDVRSGVSVHAACCIDCFDDERGGPERDERQRSQTRRFASQLAIQTDERAYADRGGEAHKDSPEA